MDDSGKFLVIASLLPASTEVSLCELTDLNMLFMSGGQERTEAEFGRLFNASGFCLIRVVPTLAPVSILEGIPAWITAQLHPGRQGNIFVMTSVRIIACDSHTQATYIEPAKSPVPCQQQQLRY
jgi:hypothetical protein